MNLTWDDAKVVAHDLETSGRLPEYALQPWRMARGDMWITSASTVVATVEPPACTSPMLVRTTVVALGITSPDGLKTDGPTVTNPGTDFRIVLTAATDHVCPGRKLLVYATTAARAC